MQAGIIFASFLTLTLGYFDDGVKVIPDNLNNFKRDKFNVLASAGSYCSYSNDCNTGLCCMPFDYTYYSSTGTLYICESTSY